MCRNITTLRGLEPVATTEEVRAAALQFVRKVGGITTVTDANALAVDRAVMAIAAATSQLINELPPRRSVPKSEPPLRRLQRRTEERAHG